MASSPCAFRSDCLFFPVGSRLRRPFLWPGGRPAPPPRSHSRLFCPVCACGYRSVYDNLADNVTVGETLPPNCIANGCAQATNNGTYPFAFNNVSPDAIFGITSRIFLDQLFCAL
jgi:hypothetical protein